jgi:hypothetical protein
VNGGDRAVVAGVHRLEHVERRAVADLTDDDPVRTHTEGVLHQIADRDLAAAFDVGGTGLEAQHVLLMQLELGGILDGDDALVHRDVSRQDVQRRRLPGAGTARDDDVPASSDAGVQQVTDLGRERPEGQQVAVGERVRGELPDRQHRPVDRDRWDDRVDTGTVREPGIN